MINKDAKKFNVNLKFELCLSFYFLEKVFKAKKYMLCFMLTAITLTDVVFDTFTSIQHESINL